MSDDNIFHIFKIDVEIHTHILQVKISTTFPALCRADMGPAITFLESTVLVSTIDYNGRPRVDGGDPIEISLKDSNGDECDYQLTDRQDGRAVAVPGWFDVDTLLTLYTMKFKHPIRVVFTRDTPAPTLLPPQCRRIYI